jgi:hypothetical protein
MIYTYVANTNALHNKAIAQPPTSINGSDQEREREREIGACSLTWIMRDKGSVAYHTLRNGLSKWRLGIERAALRQEALRRVRDRRHIDHHRATRGRDQGR